MSRAAKEPFLGPAEVLFLALPGAIICLGIAGVAFASWVLG